MIPEILIAYLVVLNIIGFWSMRNDKRKAITHSRRTPEKTLFAYALLGGSLGSLVGMRVYHHKTKHLSFILAIPTILLLQAAAITLGFIYL